MAASFDKLVKEVEKIDKDAARYLQGDAQKLSSFHRREELCGVMVWFDTPQGHEYWAELNSKLRNPELIKGGKPMKENKKAYPKNVYVSWRCQTNEDRTLEIGEKPGEFKDGIILAVYEFKKLVKVEMRPHITDVKE